MSIHKTIWKYLCKYVLQKYKYTNEPQGDRMKEGKHILPHWHLILWGKQVTQISWTNIKIFLIHWGIFFYVFFFFFETKFWEKAQAGEGQRERETEEPKQAPRWQQRARRGARTHESRDHDLSQSQMLNRATQVPPLAEFWKETCAFSLRIVCMVYTCPLPYLPNISFINCILKQSVNMFSPSRFSILLVHWYRK